MIDFLGTIFNIFIAIVFLLVKLILAPIDALILAVAPELSNAITAIANMFTTVTSFLGWILDATGIPYSGILLLVAYYIIKLTLPLQLLFLKTALNWYKTFKP